MTLVEHQRKVDALNYDLLSEVHDQELRKLILEHTNYVKYKYTPEQVVGIGKKCSTN